MQLSVGSVRMKNAKNIVLKNLLDACFGALTFYLIGAAFPSGDCNCRRAVTTLTILQDTSTAGYLGRATLPRKAKSVSV